MNMGVFSHKAIICSFVVCLSANIIASCHAIRSVDDDRTALAEAPTDTLPGDCKPLFALELAASFLATDVLLNCYVAMPDGRLLLFDSTGVLQAQFGNFSRGELSDLDLSRPLRPLLFYRDFSEIVVLDMRLAELSSFPLRQAGLVQSTAVCRAREGNGLWVYESTQGVLYKLNEQGKILTQSSPLPFFLEQPNLDFRWLRLSNRYLLLAASGRGFVLFDALGQFLRFVALEDIQGVQVLPEDRFLLTAGGKLLLFEAGSNTLQPISLPCSPFQIRQGEVREGRFYLRRLAEIIVLPFANIER